MMSSTLILLLTLAPLMQDPPSHEPIHPTNRVFTADEFRQRLLVLRGEKEILRLFGNSDLSKDQQRKLLEFAKRISEKTKPDDGKKDLPIPPELLRNPEVQKILEDEKLLGWLADNQRVQEMAERMASRWNLPDLAPRSRLPTRSGRPGNGSTPRENQIGPREEEQAGVVSPENAPATFNPGGSAETEPSKGTTSKGPTTDPGPAPPRRPLQKLTDELRKIGPLSKSATLDRVDEMLDGSLPRPASIPTPSIPSASPEPIPPIPEPWSIFQGWNELPFVQNEPVTIADIPLPPGLEQWAPTIDRVQIPAIPLPDIDIGSGSMPAFPPLPVGMEGKLSAAGWQAPVSIMVILVAGMLLARYLAVAGWWRPASLGFEGPLRVRPPAHPFDPHSRSSIREWVEFAAFKILGRKATSMSHADWALAIQATVSTPAWPELYAQARYLPPHQPVDPTLAQQAATELPRLTDSPSTSPRSI
ncbi:hypothetical protein K2X85_14835 [bacterium]|nr:hypothetical protein [bacterium]